MRGVVHSKKSSCTPQKKSEKRKIRKKSEKNPKKIRKKSEKNPKNPKKIRKYKKNPKKIKKIRKINQKIWKIRKKSEKNPKNLKKGGRFKIPQPFWEWTTPRNFGNLWLGESNEWENFSTKQLQCRVCIALKVFQKLKLPLVYIVWNIDDIVDETTQIVEFRFKSHRLCWYRLMPTLWCLQTVRFRLRPKIPIFSVSAAFRLRLPFRFPLKQ